MGCDKCGNRLELREGKVAGDNIYCHDCWCKEQGKVNTSWLQLDGELQKDGWHLQLTRHYDEWKALYTNQCEIPRSAKGNSAQEAVGRAYKLIREGK